MPAWLGRGIKVYPDTSNWERTVFSLLGIEIPTCLFSKEERSKLILAKDKINKSPFILLAQNTNRNEDSVEIWEEFEDLMAKNYLLDIEHLFTPNPKDEDSTILHYCGTNGNFVLFSKICHSKQFVKYVKNAIISTITTLVTCISDEKILQTVFETCNWEEFTDDCKKIIFHHICDKNFINCLHFVRSITTFDDFVQQILSTGNHS